MAAVLVVPLFQTEGYNSYMGIIDKSVTYTFFYALPLGLLLLFFLPFYSIIFNRKEKKFHVPVKIFVLLLVFTLPLSGPLIPGIVLIVCPLVLLNNIHFYFTRFPAASFSKRFVNAVQKLPAFFLFTFIFISLLSLYSLYIGSHNANNLWDPVSLKDRYLRLPAGLYYQFTQKLGWPLLLLMIACNAIIVRKKYHDAQGQKIIHMLIWICIFSAVYILLLPLGGFRIYRPNILRYDTIMPITVCMVFFFGSSTYFLIERMAIKYRKLYLCGIFIFLGVFTFADKLDVNENACERKALQKIAQSPDKIVVLENGCTVMSWDKITDYHTSELNAALLQYWGVTKEKKLYYQQ